MVKSDKILSTKEYVEKYMGFTPELKETEDELRNILDANGYLEIWDYPLSEIDHILEDDIDVVLVSTGYKDEDGNYIDEYRWFEVIYRNGRLYRIFH